MSENVEHGGISIELEHIFPIIKKWLYSEKEIFVREIVSNACDAITKLRRLNSLGKTDVDLSGAKIKVILDKDASTITVTDTGIGMTEDELKKYICQIALSGALDFIQKYEGENGSDNGIIGHFGLGFYSSFMVSDTVDVITRSYLDNDYIKWTCSDDGNYEITTDFDKEEAKELIGSFGTAVVMHINDEGKEFLSEYKLREVLNKYCAFMPEEIYFDDGKQDEHEEHSEHDDNCECDECKDEKKEIKPINDTHPLWLKNPSDCTDEEYKEFYRKLFNDWKEPLFYIHIKADYPLNFKGILYFPRIGSEFESLEGQVKLYYNQVFVADNIKEVIPEYLLMLKGVLDCPELPLNVSRSYLQNSGYVSKISAHITKKVADKINSMFQNDREKYESIWRDLKTFVEYGCMRDHKFYDKVSQSILFETTDGKYITVDDYLNLAKDKYDNKIYYASDTTAQSKYIKMFKDEGVEVIVLDKVIDTQFVNVIESNHDGVKFIRVDSEIADVMKADGDNTAIPAVEQIFKTIAGEHTSITFERLKDKDTPAILNLKEESRRMNDMMKLYKMGNDMPVEQTLIINTASPLIDKIVKLTDEGRNDDAETIARQIYMLSSLTQRQLNQDELISFLHESYDILGKI